ncbi:MAG: sensor histidine kinase [Rhodothermaceae bacterium]
MIRFIKILFVILVFMIPANAGSKDSVYTNHKINLMKQNGWNLFKGEEKVLVASKLDYKEIARTVSKESGIWWIEKDFYVPAYKINKGNIWLSVWSKFGAFEAYVNNKLIIKNGTIGNAETEKPGNIFVKENIPPHVMKLFVEKPERESSKRNTRSEKRLVKQSLKIKFSNFFNSSYSKFSSVTISSRNQIQTEIDNGVYMPLFLGGFFLLAMFVNIAFYFALNRKVVFLLLAALFFCNMIVVARFFVTYSFNPSIIYYWLINGSFIAANFIAKLLLIVVLLFEFEIRKKYQVIFFFISLISITAVYTIPYDQTLYYFISPVIPLMLSLWALYKKKTGSLLISTALLILLIFTYLNYDRTMTYGLTIGMMVFAVVMIFSVARKIFNQSKAYQQSLLKSSILENKLLQKHIQPHFLMNSLMSLQELIDVDRERASEMVELLSKEFHLLATFSKQKLISLEDELEICRIHLRIMSYQQRASFELKTSGINGNESIPPAVIHTLVENGLTHGYAGKENGYFQLDKFTENNFTKYRLFNDGKTQGTRNKKNTGLGLKYVEARLEESYPGKWKLISQPVENGWEAIIEIGN